MAVDPRKFLVTRPCSKHVSQGIEQSSRAEGFFKTLGKVGDLEVLNKANSKIGSGLRTLGAISENVRNDSGPVPSIIRKTGTAILDAGADFVLDTVGVGAVATRTQGAQFSPQVANRALGQATSIYEAVREGRFDSFEDLPTAIAEFSNMEQLLRSIFTGSNGRVDLYKDQCVSPYAMDLIARAPKQQFMFVVEFIINDDYQENFVTYENLAKELAFVIKRSSRPNISFEYEEVNMYNYRTKVAKRVEYQPMTMSFYDDIQGKAGTFWNHYLRAMSPLSDQYDITGQLSESGFNLNSKMLEVNGMNSSNAGLWGPQQDRFGSAGIGGLINQNTSIIKQINLYHVYSSGTRYDRYVFMSPKITEMQLSDLDMSTAGEGTEVNFTFSYDALILDTALTMDSESSNRLHDLSNVGNTWPMQPPVYGQAPAGNSEENKNRGLLGTITSGITSGVTQATDWASQGIGGVLGKSAKESENV